MNSSPDQAYKRFLLGIATEDEESRAEEAILSGTLDALSVQTAEDELIDEYLFGSLIPEENRAFEEHFLVTEDRRQRLRFAASLLEYAHAHPMESASPKPQLVPDSVRATPLWKRAFLATAATILLATLVIFDQMRLRRQTQIANETRNELTRLQSSLAATSAGVLQAIEHPTEPPLGIYQSTTDQIVAIKLGSSTRGVYPVVLHIPAQAKFVRIDIELPLPLAARYREVLLAPDGESLWAQEFPSSILPTPAKSTIVLPATILRPGAYHFRLDAAPAESKFTEAAEWVLQVPAE